MFKNQMQPKVSIIMPCYNNEKYVKEAINSALNQTYSNIEIICIDDSSKDDSAKLIKKFVQEHHNIKLINNKINLGVIKSRNIAIENATGEYILPLDCDDILEESFVEKAVKVLNANLDIGIVYCDVVFFGKKSGVWDTGRYSLSKMLISNQICATALFRKTDFIKVGGYKEYMKNGCEDWDLWLSFLELGLKPYKIKEPLFKYRKYKKHSRTDNCIKHINEVRFQIVKQHCELYLSNPDIVDRIFAPNFERSIKVEKKYKKYKLLFNIFVVFFVIELILIAGILLAWGHGISV